GTVVASEGEVNAMSFWLTHWESSRITITLAQGGDLFSCLFLVVFLAVLSDGRPRPRLVIIAIGFSCVLLAKPSLFRRGLWVSWGSRQVTHGYARLYWLGYALMGLGALLTLPALLLPLHSIAA